jgi:hypothetical protein
MHALNRVSRVTGDPVFNTWALEMAKSVHQAFIHAPTAGPKQMVWKVSIDLSHPLVPYMGQHDPLDGFITYTQLQATAQALSHTHTQNLHSEIADMEALCRDQNWATDDPLGLGGLLWDAYRVVQLIIKDGFTNPEFVNHLLKSALTGLEICLSSRLLSLPASERLAFRELGLSIGLHAVERMEEHLAENPDKFQGNHPLYTRLNQFSHSLHLADDIEKFWLNHKNRQPTSWTDHLDINRVMLATSLAPDGFLEA